MLIHNSQTIIACISEAYVADEVPGAVVHHQGLADVDQLNVANMTLDGTTCPAPLV